MKNQNLFKYATSELSQDAFICWLTSYAYKDPNQEKDFTEDDLRVRECAQEFLHMVISEEKKENLYLTELPEQQYEHIDVLLTVNNKYKVIIEDKVFTSEHDDQLKKYTEKIKENYPGFDDIRGVYFKWGFQSDKAAIEKAGYQYFGIEKLKELLNNYKDIDNNIFNDYSEKINDFRNLSEQYREKKISEWEWEQINGFFDYFQSKVKESDMKADYGYIPNQSGGFYGMWIWDDNNRIKKENTITELYLQCEFRNKKLAICFKASKKENKGKSKFEKSERDYLIGAKEGNTRRTILEEFEFERPNHIGLGATVTLGVCKINEEAGYEEAEKRIKDAIKKFKECRERIITELNLETKQ